MKEIEDFITKSQKENRLKSVLCDVFDDRKIIEDLKKDLDENLNHKSLTSYGAVSEALIYSMLRKKDDTTFGKHKDHNYFSNISDSVSTIVDSLKDPKDTLELRDHLSVSKLMKAMELEPNLDTLVKSLKNEAISMNIDTVIKKKPSNKI